MEQVLNNKVHKMHWIINICQPLLTLELVQWACGQSGHESRDEEYKMGPTTLTLNYQGCFNDCCLWMSNLSVTDNNDEFSTWHCSWRKSPNHLILSKLDQAPFIMEEKEKSYHRNLHIFWVWAHLSYLQSFMCLLGTYRILHWQK